jgi:hypothetical protein
VAFAKAAITTRGVPIGVGESRFFGSLKDRAIVQPFPDSGGEMRPEEIIVPWSDIDRLFPLEYEIATGKTLRAKQARKRGYGD